MLRDAGPGSGSDRTFWHVGAGWQYQGTRLAEGAVGRGAAKLTVLTPYYFAAIGSAMLS
jgi:4-hydroxy-tetrahydrodipicolinate synthase